MTPALERLDWYRFLGRRRLPQPTSESLQIFRDERILVTGAGGSIGSALALRLATLAPANLILLDSSESRLFALDRQWATKAPTAVTPVLGSVNDSALVDEVFSLHAPTLVFHAAAYKHVPLLEEQPLAAIENNVFGTEQLRSAAASRRARVVLVSTDKAVDPASVMGATKRIAEYLVLGAGGTALRLANVLGSRDSVAEVFAEQIATGRPLTVTDPAARRFFVTLEEAVDLLLAAAAERDGAGLFVPNLKQAHFIADLARFMTGELHRGEAGHECTSIPVEFTALRPGDKEAEQLWSDKEEVAAACSPGLLSIASRLPSPTQIRGALAALRSALDDRNLPAALAEMRAGVPGYVPSQTVLALAARATERTTP